MHIDSGDVRYWPRMNRDALARLFPDGKTVFIPSRRPADAGLRPGAGRNRSARRRGAGRQRRQIPPPAAGCSPGWWARKPAAPTTRKRASGVEAAPTARGGRAPAPAAAQVASADAPREAPASAAAPQPTPTPPPPRPNDSADAAAADPNDGDFPAPLPPRKPVELILADAPTPPARPTELAFAPAADTSGDRDLIAALLARGGLPGVITRGVGAPRGILALTEVDAPEPPERPAILDRAAALNAPLPPLPPRPDPGRGEAGPERDFGGGAGQARRQRARPRPDRPRARAAFAGAVRQPLWRSRHRRFCRRHGPDLDDGDRRAARRDALADKIKRLVPCHKAAAGGRETICVGRPEADVRRGVLRSRSLV